ncbi:MAG: SRPBCC domain-containing protein [Cyclobacteriaceae bacterium]
MVIRKTYSSDLAKEMLYNAWLSPLMTIDPVTKIECDPVVGGELKLYSKSEYGDGVMSGKFALVEPGEKLMYSWHWEGSEETTQVNVQFLKIEEGTEVQIVHSGFISNESKEMHDSGWDHYFRSLEDKIRQTGFQ